jgi:hypothetical protein
LAGEKKTVIVQNKKKVAEKLILSCSVAMAATRKRQCDISEQREIGIGT